MLAYYLAPPEPGRPLEVRMVDLMSDMQPIHRLIENIIFTKNGRSYTQSSIDEIQLLHYKVVKKNDLFDNTAVQPEGMTSPETNAEYLTCLVVSYETHISITEDCGVLLKQTQYYRREMKTELFVMSLKAPLPHEKIVLQLHAGSIHTERISMPESDIYVVQSKRSGQLRLIMVSWDGCTVLSQELSKDFLPKHGGRPNFRSPTGITTYSQTLSPRRALPAVAGTAAVKSDRQDSFQYFCTACSFQVERKRD
ncbi:hypothetical protein VTH82DRAFT_3269 [Thermothelomyces myriococcoides]